MANGTKKKRHLLPKLLAVAVVLGLIIVAAWYLLAGRLPDTVPSPVPEPGPGEQTSQPADCADVSVIAIPGTWESSATDDPYNPSANPLSLMLNVTRPLQEQFEPGRASVYTVPYVAQFSNPIAFPPDGQQSYNNSRTAGTAAAKAELTRVSEHCPLTSYILAGFSQGAVIAGDIAAEIGAGNGPVSADKVLGVTLIADGRRDGTSGQDIGPPVDGVGAEVALGGLDFPGVTMTGARAGGFGSLDSVVNQICAPGDLICTAPSEGLSLRNIPQSLGILVGAAGNPVHASYNTFVVDDSGTTSTQWTAQWAAGLIEQAPAIPHS
ncbi:cutinase family protein [Rhodococcus sp. PAMC28707]|uniref:cutinase family protein n=1 Tax=unclassified Rhodococcus (in: high G+C Gram-positive bacteria) TaxID=192944 RepID=UPI00109DD6C5|nr:MULTISPECIES: cutinase family protein [unclassified Rhodococcus (in: high G+C Gram-positive bacteria)]QCB49593.1 cutinase family protein [Rhodococcus sp. PAMC28705]QCB58718.1 cutinase family protein [Rhodococcus sp. PAMC28707]